MINEKITESVMFSGNILLDGRSIINLSANVTSEVGGYPNISVSVTDGQSYTANKEEVDERIMAFMVKVLSKQAEVHAIETPAVV